MNAATVQLYLVVSHYGYLDAVREQPFARPVGNTFRHQHSPGAHG